MLFFFIVVGTTWPTRSTWSPRSSWSLYSRNRIEFWGIRTTRKGWGARSTCRCQCICLSAPLSKWFSKPSNDQHPGHNDCTVQPNQHPHLNQIFWTVGIAWFTGYWWLTRSFWSPGRKGNHLQRLNKISFLLSLKPTCSSIVNMVNLRLKLKVKASVDEK